MSVVPRVTEIPEVDERNSRDDNNPIKTQQFTRSINRSSALIIIDVL
jgi:hypothetical protein